MKYAALLKDSLVETLDRKSFYVLLTVSGLLILLCASIGFRQLDAAGALAHIVKEFKSFPLDDNPRTSQSFDVTYEVLDVTPVEDTYSFYVEASSRDDFHRQVWEWAEQAKRSEKREGEAPPSPELEARFLKSQFSKRLIMRAEIEPQDSEAGKRRFKVTIPKPRYVTLDGAHEATFLFGAFSARLPFSLAIFLVIVEGAVANVVAGFFGLLIAVVFTAGFVPGMLQKGTLDLILAKPVRRPLVLLLKYLGGILYVLIPAIALIGGCWLAISWRSGFFNYGFLATIGILVWIFAVLYSFTVLMGVLTRSTIASILLTIGLWFASFILSVIVTLPDQGVPLPDPVVKTADRLRLAFPRTSELGEVASYCIVKGNLGPELEAAMNRRGGPEEVTAPPWGSLALSSACFIAVMLGLACWLFSRRDY